MKPANIPHTTDRTSATRRYNKSKTFRRRAERWRGEGARSDGLHSDDGPNRNLLVARRTCGPNKRRRTRARARGDHRTCNLGNVVPLLLLPPLPPLWLGSDEARDMAAVAATAAAADDAIPELSRVNERWYRAPSPVLPANVIDESMPL